MKRRRWRNCSGASATFANASGGDRKCNQCQVVLSPAAAERHRNAHDRSPPKPDAGLQSAKVYRDWGGVYRVKCTHCRIASRASTLESFKKEPVRKCEYCSTKFRAEL
ncbi:hypothetical protein EPO05_05170 [Patescibacteria group bacterium]|nr:MAG: hypothetical protein EPO05_05170 [Patescibacteria group bacterium]